MDDRRIFRNLLFSYIAIVLVVVAFIGIFTAGLLFTRLSEDTKKLNNNVVDQTHKMLDNHFSDLLSLSNQFKNNNEFQYILSNEIPNPSERVYRFWKTANEFYSYQLTNSHIENIAFYSNKNRTIIDSASIYTEQEFYERYFINSGMSPDDFVEKISRLNLTHCFISTGSDNDDNSGDMLVFCQGLNNGTTQDAGLFMAFVDKQKLIDDLKIEDDGHLKSFGVVDKNGTVILKTKDFDIDSKLLNLSAKEGEFTHNGYVVQHKESDTINVNYINTFTKNAVSGNIRYVAIVFLLILFVSVIISIVAARYSVNKIHAPLMAVLDKNKYLEKNMNEQREFVKSKMFLNLLHNIRLNTSENSVLRSISFPSKYCRVFIASSSNDDYPYVYDEKISSAWKEADAVISGILSKQSINYHRVRLDETAYAYILNYKEYDIVKKSLETISATFLERYGVYLNLSVGEEVESVNKINLSYESAQFVRRYIKGSESGVPCFYDNVRSLESTKLYFTVEKEQALLRNIKTGETASLLELFDEIYRVNFLERRLPPNLLKRLVMNLSMVLYEALDDLYWDNGLKKVYTDECDDVLRNDDAEKSFRDIKELCVNLSREIEDDNDDSYLKSKIEAYIEQNYDNCYLSLNMLAEYISKSYNYVSKLFNDIFGMTFVHYLTNLRLEKAKQLLKTTDLTVEQIAIKTGYSSANQFIKTFKKYYDQTPGQYRK